MKKLGLLFIVVALILSVPVVKALEDRLFQEPEMEQITYTVGPYDTLYSIAADFGIEDWRKWSYEVCELNGINGGEIFAGDEIIILVEKGLK